MDYQIMLGEDKHQYSVYYRYIEQTTKIIYDENNVEIYIGLKRIAFHKRDYRKHAYTTLPEDMPEKHLRYNETLGCIAILIVTCHLKNSNTRLDGSFIKLLIK